MTNNPKNLMSQRKINSLLTMVPPAVKYFLLSFHHVEKIHLCSMFHIVTDSQRIIPPKVNTVINLIYMIGVLGPYSAL